LTAPSHLRVAEERRRRRKRKKKKKKEALQYKLSHFRVVEERSSSVQAQPLQSCRRKKLFSTKPII
jgi:hypothetical protein